MPKIVVDKFLINYDKIGQGSDPVFFLHGWGTSGTSFKPMALQLTKNNPNISIYLLDLPGFGESNFPGASMSVTDYAGIIKDLLLKLEIVPVAFIGHSFGGRVLIKYFQKNRVGAKLILTGAAGVAERPAHKNYFYLVAAKIGKVIFSLPGLRKWREKAQLGLYRKIGNEDYVNAGNLKETFKKVVAEDLSEAAAEVEAKTLLIWGDKDNETPLSEGEKLQRLIEGSKLKIIEGAGHYAFLDNPEQFGQVAGEFLK